MYLRVWRWRTRYANLGGLGTGIGEGNEGVKCGLGAQCIAATEVEVEVDIDDAGPLNTHTSSSSNSASSSKSSTSSDTSMNGAVTDDEEETAVKGPIYGTHEIEGIGGVVRRKAIKKVRIGACVEELEDEREGRCEYMARETSGEERSWCAWCWRIVPRNGELADRA
ncbi:MAG: hypothetical protein M1824_004314 [Vezdaea acicularis]|nr:MAG: hypothetical protein M1824_004314 [Vezdaea acicularis]